MGLLHSGLRSIEEELLLLDSEDGFVSPEIPEGMPYFLVGLSGGYVQPNDVQSHVTLDMARYVEHLGENGGKAVMFNPIRMSNPEDTWGAWDDAVAQMEIRVQAIARALGYPDLQVVRASDYCDLDRARFNKIIDAVCKLFFAAIGEAPDERLLNAANKVWKIIPRDEKVRVGEKYYYYSLFGRKLEDEANFEDIKAPISSYVVQELMYYELLHIAFILACDGNKILHGRSEERSKQVVGIMRDVLVNASVEEADSWGIVEEELYGVQEYLGAWKGKVVNPKELRAKRPSSGYLSPYHQIKEWDTHRVAVDFSGFLPLTASLNLVDPLVELAASVGAERIVAYLKNNLPAGISLERELAQVDFSDRDSVLVFLSALFEKFVWPINLAELAILKEKGDARYIHYLRSRLAHICSEFRYVHDGGRFQFTHHDGYSYEYGYVSPYFSEAQGSYFYTAYTEEELRDTLKTALENTFDPSTWDLMDLPDDKRVVLRGLVDRMLDIYKLLGGEDGDLQYREFVPAEAPEISLRERVEIALATKLAAFEASRAR